MENLELQESVLFDDSVSHINTSSNDSNIVHKRAVTSTSFNYNRISKEMSILIDKPQQHNIMMSFV